MTKPRKPSDDARSLVMPPGRRIPRQPPSAPSRPEPPVDVGEIPLPLAKAAGELSSLATTIRACQRCPRASSLRALGSGYPQAPVMLLKAEPTAADLETGSAFTSEAEALTKAFEALDVPIAWVYGSTAVRCGSDVANADDLAACSAHVLVEIEAVRPRVLIAFGERACAAVRALDGRCGIRVAADLVSGEAVRVRSDLTVLATEGLPEGITQKEAKRRLWRDLRELPSLLAP